MGFRSLWKKIYRLHLIYNLPRQARVELKKIIRTRGLDAGDRRGARRVPVKIWYRNLEPLDKNPVTRWLRPIRRIGHWCVQVEDTYFELKIPEQPRYRRYGRFPKLAELCGGKPISLGITHGQNPFPEDQRRLLKKETSTSFSAEEVEQKAREVWNKEFEGEAYSASWKNCQLFVSNFVRAICPPEDIEELYLYLYSKTFAFSLENNRRQHAHREHLKEVKRQTDARYRSERRRHVPTCPPAPRHNIAAAGWFQAALVNNIIQRHGR